MDKSWIRDRNRFSRTYVNGVKSFINFVKQNLTGPHDLIRCPCVICNNAYYKNTDEVECHLYINGFSKTYVNWIHHGETFPIVEDNEDEANENEMGDNNYDVEFDNSDIGDDLNELLADMMEAQPENDNGEETTAFGKLLEDAQRELYPGCKISLLSAVVKLLHLKVLGKWSNKSFAMLLKFMKDVLPEGDVLPSTLHGAIKTLVEIGLGYEEIDACKNDCVLFWRDNEKKDACPICNESRWKSINGSKRVPHKKLRYFPLKNRLQRLFMCRKIASKMRWHKEKREDDEGISRHPADSLAWKHFDNQYPDFAKDSRNVRLGLASDGFTPWSNLGLSHSMWPVMLTIYNLPPYDCMRSPYIMMSLLIPGPDYPGKDIDVYLQPLVEELKELWDIGVETYDIHGKEKFQLHAAVLWTISDFPGYGLLSGWSTSGRYACPCCLSQTDSHQLRTKTCFMGSRRFLDENHPFRKNRVDFNGKTEHRKKPIHLSGDDVLHWLDELHTVFGKFGKHPGSNKKRKRDSHQANWVKKSIFFELPYWHKLLIRHNLDVMHIEKNICENVLWTLLDVQGKTKDLPIAREDLFDLGIREELHLQQRGNKRLKPAACFTLSASERNEFCQFLKSIKYPDGFAANISRRVKANKISGLKSHDFHILLQRLIPDGIRGLLPKQVSEVLYELGDYFKELCCKTLKDADVERLHKNIPIILCKLEKIFPPYFFTVMVHLSIHLAEEAKIAGPVQFRWMYPIERFLGSLKGFIRNRARQEGSIAEGYIVSESLTFLSMYLPDMETRFNRPTRNYDGEHETQSERISVFSMRTRPFVQVKSKCLISEEEINKAHWYILSNCDEVRPYLKIHKSTVKGINLDQIGDDESYDPWQIDSFPRWFKEHMNQLRLQKSEKATNDMWALANGPLRLNTRFYNGCIVNQVRFHTKKCDELRQTQNSGLVVKANHRNEIIDFFGFLRSVVELNYICGYKVILFKCEWYDMGNKKTKNVDKHFTSVNINSRWYKDEPFILPSQAQQVFYINDTKLGKNWQIVQHVQHRHLWDLPEVETENVVDAGTEEQTLDTEAMQQYQSSGVNLVVDLGIYDHLQVRYSREDVEPKEFDVNIVQKKLKNRYGKTKSVNTEPREEEEEEEEVVEVEGEEEEEEEEEDYYDEEED